jgi:hypothetical protein
MKVSELTGAALDWAVAKCIYEPDDVVICDGRVFAYDDATNGFNPSTNWAQGGPIIEREKIGVWWATHYVDEDGVEYGNHWYAEVGCTDENADSRYCGVADGPTPLIAAMRCYVAMKMGDEIELPEELR